MNIPVKVTSKISGRVVEGHYRPRQLLDILDEVELVNKLTMCECEPIGETYVIDCGCDEEWYEYELLIGDEIK